MVVDTGPAIEALAEQVKAQAAQLERVEAVDGDPLRGHWGSEFRVRHLGLRI